MSLYNTFLLLIFATTYLGIFFLRIFHYGFIYEQPAAIILGCVPTVTISFFLILACAIAEKPIITRFSAIIKKAKNDRDSITEKDVADLRSCYRKFDIAIAIGDAVGFLLGAGSTAIIESAKGLAPFNPIVFVIIELQSMSVGFLCYTINVFTIKNVLMQKQLDEANIRGVAKNMQSTLAIAFVTCVFLAMMNMITVPIHLLQQAGGDSFFIFLRYCVIGTVATAIACYAAFTLLINRIQKNEREISSGLLSEMNTLTDATKESARTSQDQSTSVKEIVATMQDSTALASSIGKKIEMVTTHAEKSQDAVSLGSEALENNVRELLAIKETNTLTIEGIKELNSRINSIWDIVSIINNVADQTKIIAFNAELEASSSGEAGKNFHIVATEIRRLSDNILDSIKEIREKIDDIQSASSALIVDSQKSTEQIDSGYKNVKTLESHFESIKQSSDDTASSAKDILEYVSQLESSSEQIFITLKQIAHGVESFSKSTEEISAASEKVKEIAEKL